MTSWRRTASTEEKIGRSEPAVPDAADGGRDGAGSAAVLSVEALDVSFRTDGSWKPIVRSAAFSLLPRETLAIVGESGSGKSVTALSLMRLLPRRNARIEGRILLDGTDLLSLTDRDMRKIRGNRIAMIFQDPMTSLNPVFPVGDQIAEAITEHAAIAHASARAEAVRLLDRVRIGHARSRFRDYPHQFSGGMRQRVMIAMALASRPSVLIADEPTTALDVTIQGQILDLMKDLQDEEGMAILFITHDMGVVAEIADRTIVMRGGEMIESGSTETIFAHAGHPYTKALLAAVPRLGSMHGTQLPRRFPSIDVDTGEPRPLAEIADTVLRNSPPVVEVRKLAATYRMRSGLFSRTGAVHALEDVSFEVHAGETLALVGESGCGKSTTARCLTRLVEPSAGEITIDGFDVRNLDGPSLRRLRRSVQMVFQDPFASLNPKRTIEASIVEPFVDHGLGTRAEGRDKAADLLERVGLEAGMMRRHPHEFSGGQRQRICIMRALMLDPKVIIADEAVSALDVSIKAQVCNLLIDLQQQMQLAYIFISHDMAVVERVAHRVAVMKSGRIVEIGPRSSVFDRPQHPYTRRLMEAVPIPDPLRRSIRRDVPDEDLEIGWRAPGHMPPSRSYAQVGPGHLVEV